MLRRHHCRRRQQRRRCRRRQLGLKAARLQVPGQQRVGLYVGRGRMRAVVPGAGRPGAGGTKSMDDGSMGIIACDPMKSRSSCHAGWMGVWMLGVEVCACTYWFLPTLQWPSALRHLGKQV
eukprot:356298-Chlamydomonas_euryale.AAC.5